MREACDNCHQGFEYSGVSTYAETTWIKRADKSIEYYGFLPGWQPVLMAFDLGHSKVAYYCEECAKKLGYSWPKRIK